MDSPKTRYKKKMTVSKKWDFLHVTKKGQVTVPIALRQKYHITEETLLKAEDNGNGVLFVPQESIFDFAGCLADKMTPEEAEWALDEIRDQDNND